MTIEETWENFRRRALKVPAAAPGTELLRLAYYAGAYMMFTAMAISTRDMTEEGAVFQMDLWKAEFDRFHEALREQGT